ncbi:MAG TPA: thermonuclease family protein, partial [Anaerolineales bacterium]
NMFSDVSDKDSAGRLLRYVTVGDNFVNLILVQHGFATAASAQPNVACDAVFQSAQQTAQQSQAGMWIATPTLKSP